MNIVNEIMITKSPMVLQKILINVHNHINIYYE